MSSKLRKILSLALSLSLLFQQVGFAQIATELNIASHFSRMASNLTIEKFRPLHLRYFSYDSLNSNFKVLLDKGDEFPSNRGHFPSWQSGNSSKESVPGDDVSLKEKTKTLLNYFLVGVSLPDSAFWVNLRPDSENNIIDEYLSKTDVGRIMLEADLQLKKDTSSMTSPSTPEGREYWDKLYKKAANLYGNDNITIPTLTRPWIVPSEIIVRESSDSAYIYKATLKVMLEQDYLKDSSTYNFQDTRAKALNEYSSELIRQLIIPKLTREVNSSKRYAPLRQVYYSLILSRWFKQKFNGKSGTYASLINTKDLTNLISTTSWSKTDYFNQYKKSFTDGEYSIKEPVYTPTGQTIRSYFSGGLDLKGAGINNPSGFTSSPINPKVLNSGILMEGSSVVGIRPAFASSLTNAELFRKAETREDVEDFDNLVQRIKADPQSFAANPEVYGFLASATTSGNEKIRRMAQEVLDAIKTFKESGKYIISKPQYFTTNAELFAEAKKKQGTNDFYHLTQRIKADPRSFLEIEGLETFLAVATTSGNDRVREMSRDALSIINETRKQVFASSPVSASSPVKAKVGNDKLQVLLNKTSSDILDILQDISRLDWGFMVKFESRLPKLLNPGIRNQLVSSLGLYPDRNLSSQVVVIKDLDDAIKKATILHDFFLDKFSRLSDFIDNNEDYVNHLQFTQAEILISTYESVAFGYKNSLQIKKDLEDFKSAASPIEISQKPNKEQVIHLLKQRRLAELSLLFYRSGLTYEYVEQLVKNIRPDILQHPTEPDSILKPHSRNVIYLKEPVSITKDSSIDKVVISYYKEGFIVRFDTLTDYMRVTVSNSPWGFKIDSNTFSDSMYLPETRALCDKLMGILEKLNSNSAASPVVSAISPEKEMQEKEQELKELGEQLKAALDKHERLSNGRAYSDPEALEAAKEVSLIREAIQVANLDLRYARAKLGLSVISYGSVAASPVTSDLKIGRSIKDGYNVAEIHYIGGNKEAGDNRLTLLYQFMLEELNALKASDGVENRDIGTVIKNRSNVDLTIKGAGADSYRISDQIINTAAKKVKDSSVASSIESASSPMAHGTRHRTRVLDHEGLISHGESGAVKQIESSSEKEQGSTADSNTGEDIASSTRDPAATSSPVNKEVGGIDFRALPMSIQPMGSFKGLNFTLPQLTQAQLAQINIESEIKDIQNMVNSGIRPSGQRVKELLAACNQKKEMSAKADKLLLCLINICKLEEENAYEASPELREALVIVDAVS